MFFKKSIVCTTNALGWLIHSGLLAQGLPVSSIENKCSHLIYKKNLLRGQSMSGALEDEENGHLSWQIMRGQQ